jgi:hypothetical protein
MSALCRSENLQRNYVHLTLQSCNCYSADTIKIGHCLLILHMDDWQEDPLDSWTTATGSFANDTVPE